MPNVFAAPEPDALGLRVARVAEQAGSEHLGASVYELAPGQGMVFHYHLQRRELLIVVTGSLALRTPVVWRNSPAVCGSLSPRRAVRARRQSTIRTNKRSMPRQRCRRFVSKR